MINGDADDARTVLNQVLVKQYTAPDERADGRRATPTRSRASARRAGCVAAAGHDRPDAASRRTRSAPRSGLYRDPWFGESTLCAHEGRRAFRVRKSPRLAAR